MQTELAEGIRGTAEGKDAENILRSCVHCGFCNATCPTYQILGDELDGPRGRIYLIKQVLEGLPVSRKTQRHLDRCLSCRSCETTCPSGVRYGRLLDIGRSIVEQKVARGQLDRLLRKCIRSIFPFSTRFRQFMKLGWKVQPFIPASVKRKIPPRSEQSGAWPNPRHSRKMLALNGCVQSVSNPQIDRATAQVLDGIGISLVRAEEGGCCGAMSHHLGNTDEALGFIRRNIDAWWPWIESGVESIVMTASGCGVMVKDYGELLKDDPDYAEKAQRLSEMTKDVAEVLTNEQRHPIKMDSEKRIAFHSPCTLQHGQKINGLVEKLLMDAGFSLCSVENPHLCCGSAGTYSILQKTLSERLLADKVGALEKEEPEVIVTGNIGCLLHIQSATKVPVKHWIELLVY